MNNPNLIPTEAQIKEIVEIAVDGELPNFEMTGNWYTDYDMDSLGAVALVVEVQKAFKVRLPEARMPDIRTGDDLMKIIVELQSEQGAAQTPAQTHAQAPAQTVAQTAAVTETASADEVAKVLA